MVRYCTYVKFNLQLQTSAHPGPPIRSTNLQNSKWDDAICLFCNFKFHDGDVSGVIVMLSSPVRTGWSLCNIDHFVVLLTLTTR
jgi:hypothetical protein